jgi:hypothetical protein
MIPTQRDTEISTFDSGHPNNSVAANLRPIGLHILCHYIRMLAEEKRDMNYLK